MTQRSYILEMRSITKKFPGVTALSGVNLAVRSGEIHAICGENGAGKSTLMKVLSGVHPYGSYEGDIIYRSEEMRFANVRQSEAAGIGIIHQELALIPQLSITENILLGNETARFGVIDWVSAQRRVRELLEWVGLDDHPDTLVKSLGVGKQQLVEIAKALHKSVKLLILDEPTAALNETESQHLLDLIVGLKERGVTSIMISHKLNEIEQVADSITVLRDGQSIETLDLEGGNVDEDRIIRGMVGRSLENRFPPRTPDIGDTLFEVRNWTVQHALDPSRLVCKDVNLSVRRGEIVGLAGLMGAGRTELAMSVFGRSYGTYVSGEIFKNGRPIKVGNVREAIRHRIGYVSEDRKGLGLNLLDSVRRATVSARLDKVSSRAGVIDELQEHEIAERYRAALGTKTASVDASVGKLSGGNQQKVVLSKWMFTDPDVLILDEPTRGIDVGAKYEIYKIINDLAAAGTGIILISSELPEVMGLSDRIYTIFEGRITNEFTAAEATSEALMVSMTSTRKAGAAA
ncbi:multiple monosaccharide ABC transporter ATP-binding protein [Amycolatopsis viridis]|nr:multiple monosaccharide ABC transporter ATP-binding protein [Amycolatopsis viridis]